SSFTFSVGSATNGSVILLGDGYTAQFTPSANYNGPASFTFQANDGSLDSNTATVAITVTAVNDAPVASGTSLTTAEDTVLVGSVSATDVDNTLAQLSYSLV